MQYDRPKLRSFKHESHYVSIWYSLVIHAFIFVMALSLARADLGYAANEFKEGVKSVISGIFKKELSPEDSMINELFREKIKTDYKLENLAQEKKGS